MRSFSEILSLTKTITLLYVEDDTTNREYFGDMFKEIFKEVKIASDGEEGLDLFKEFRADMVISDVRMPSKDGIEMLREIKELDPDVETIITTAHNDSELHRP